MIIFIHHGNSIDVCMYVFDRFNPDSVILFQIFSVCPVLSSDLMKNTFCIPPASITTTRRHNLPLHNGRCFKRPVNFKA